MQGVQETTRKSETHDSFSIANVDNILFGLKIDQRWFRTPPVFILISPVNSHEHTGYGVHQQNSEGEEPPVCSLHETHNGLSERDFERIEE